MSSPRFCVIDIGSNSVRVEIAEMHDCSIRTILVDRVPTRLGNGIGIDNRITNSALLQTLESIVKFVQLSFAHGVKDHNLQLIATASLRQATNGQDLIETVLSKCNKQIAVITPEQEAQYTFDGVAYSYDLASNNTAVIDFGGGSTEIVIAERGTITQIITLPFGAVTLSSQFAMQDTINMKQFTSMRQCINERLDNDMPYITFTDEVYATGGTCTALSAIELCEDEGVLSASNDLDGYILQFDAIINQLDRLIALDAKSRQQIIGISADRAETIVAGASIATLVLERFSTGSMTIHTSGLRLGVLLSMANDN